MLRLIMITNRPDLARHAVASGVDQVMVDLEIHGKSARQEHLSTVISGHTFEDLEAIRRALPDAEVMARLNPLHRGSAEEVDRAVRLGVDVIMLPMARRADHVADFSAIVNSRVPICPLIETVGAAIESGRIARLPGVSQLHIGLNDLHLDLRRRFMFEPLAEGLVDGIVSSIRESGVPFGIGGVARIDSGVLPVELVLAEHARLGSTAAILSRSFHHNATTIDELQDLPEQIRQVRDVYDQHVATDAATLARLHEVLRQRVAEIVGDGATASGSR